MVLLSHIWDYMLLWKCGILPISAPREKINSLVGQKNDFKPDLGLYFLLLNLFYIFNLSTLYPAYGYVEF